jgi:hypothetical protein
VNRVLWSRYVCPLSTPANLLPDAEVTNWEGQAQRDHFVGNLDPQPEVDPSGVFMGRILVGPLGVFPAGSHNLVSKLYKLWVGHTNFTVTEPMVNAIAAVEGIESVRAINRYRFLVGIGLLFATEEVQNRVTSLLCPPSVPTRERLVVNVLARQAASLHRCWAVLRLPSGELTVVGGDSEEQVVQRMGQHSGSEVICSQGVDSRGRGIGNDRGNLPTER